MLNSRMVTAKTMIQAAIRPLRSSGTEMSRMVRPHEAPDIRPASSSSLPSCFSALRSTKKAKGKRCAVKAIRNSQSVP